MNTQSSLQNNTHLALEEWQGWCGECFSPLQ